MNAFLRRISLRTLAPALGVALVVGGMGMAVTGASAQDNEPDLNAAEICFYDGKEYSAGAKIILGNGTVLTCQKDGSWARVVKTQPRFPRGQATGGVSIGR